MKSPDYWRKLKRENDLGEVFAILGPLILAILIIALGNKCSNDARNEAQSRCPDGLAVQEGRSNSFVCIPGAHR